MKDILIAILKNQHTQSINFTYTSANGQPYRVVPADFQLVEAAVNSGSISVREGNVADGRARYTVSQDGNDAANTFFIGKNTAAANVFASLIVHEAVHAAYDLKKIVMPWIDNEAIAYIAQGFYILSAGEDGGLSEQAYVGLEAAKQKRAGDGDPFWEESLREALANDPLYKTYINGVFRGDG